MNKHLDNTKLHFVFLVIILILGCINQKEIHQKESFEYSIGKPIEGQLYTAKILKNFMAEKQYEEAISLFSKKQQSDIRKYQNDEEMFNYWCLAWTLDERKYERFCSRIKNGNGMFVFEEGEWKIDEK